MLGGVPGSAPQRHASHVASGSDVEASTTEPGTALCAVGATSISGSFMSSHEDHDNMPLKRELVMCVLHLFEEALSLCQEEQDLLSYQLCADPEWGFG